MSSISNLSAISGKDIPIYKKIAKINDREVALLVTLPKQPVTELFCKAIEKETGRYFTARLTRLDEKLMTVTRLDTKEQADFNIGSSELSKVLKAPQPIVPDPSDAESESSTSEASESDSESEAPLGAADFVGAAISAIFGKN